MARIDSGMRSGRKRGAGLAGLVLVVAVLIGVTWLTAPRRTATTDTGKVAAAGVTTAGAKPSASPAHPGSLTLTQAGTDSRDNGTAQAGRAAPASDSTPSAPAAAGAPAAGGGPDRTATGTGPG